MDVIFVEISKVTGKQYILVPSLLSESVDYFVNHVKNIHV